MSKDTQNFSRRELLKVMTALGGSLAASTLVPSKWTKPALQAGVLPAHAQSTLYCAPPYAIMECLLEVTSPPNAPSLGLSATALISPACPGIELVPLIQADSSPDFSPKLPSSATIVKTDSNGVATYNFEIETIITAPEQFGIWVQWSFNNSGDGDGVCVTNIISLVSPT